MNQWPCQLNSNMKENNDYNFYSVFNNFAGFFFFWASDLARWIWTMTDSDTACPRTKKRHSFHFISYYFSFKTIHIHSSSFIIILFL